MEERPQNRKDNDLEIKPEGPVANVIKVAPRPAALSTLACCLVKLCQGAVGIL